MPASAKASAIAAPARRTRLGHDERRRQILDAARRLFSERHYGAVAMEDVAREAGVTRGLLHHYFGSKRDLYLAVVKEMFRGGEPPVPEYVEGMTVDERLAESVERWLDNAERNREAWVAALGVQGLGHDPEIDAILERVREAGVDNVIEVLGAGPAAAASPELRAVVRAYGGLAETATREWLGGGRLDRRQLHGLLTGSLLALVRDVLPRLERAG